MPWVYGNHYSGHWEGNRFNRIWVQNPLPDLEWRDEVGSNPLPSPNEIPARSQYDTIITSVATAGQRVPIIYGKVRTGAIVIYEKSDGSGGWYSVYLIGWGPIKSITNISMGTEPIATFNPGTINIYLGNSTTNAAVDPNLNFADANWTSRLPGLAYVFIHFRNPNTVTDGKQPDPHSFICDVEGLYAPDHRLDATLATLYYTENVSLTKHDHWINKRYGGGIPTDTIDYATVDQAATDCDFVLANGSPRFKIGIKLGPDVSPWINNDKLLGLHGQIWCSTSQGLRQMFVDGDQTASTINITDVGVSRNILTASFRLLEPEEVFNHFEFSFTDQANQFKPGSAITEDPGIALGTIYQVLNATYDTHGSPSYDQSKRLSIWAYNISKLDKEYFFDVLYEDGVECVPGLVVNVTSAEVDVTNQLMIVKLVEDIDDLSFKITCRLFSHTVYLDTPQSTFVNAPPSGPSPFGPLPAPTGVTLSYVIENGVPSVIVTFTPYVGVNAGGTRITRQTGGGTITDCGIFTSSPVKLVIPDSLGQVVTINLYSVDTNTGQQGSLVSIGTITITIPTVEKPTANSLASNVTIYISGDKPRLRYGVPKTRTLLTPSVFINGSCSFFDATKLNDNILNVTAATIPTGNTSRMIIVDFGVAVLLSEALITVQSRAYNPNDQIYIAQFSDDNITWTNLGTGSSGYAQNVVNSADNFTQFFCAIVGASHRYFAFKVIGGLTSAINITEMKFWSYGSNYLLAKDILLFDLAVNSGFETLSKTIPADLDTNINPIDITSLSHFDSTNSLYRISLRLRTKDIVGTLSDPVDVYLIVPSTAVSQVGSVESPQNKTFDNTSSVIAAIPSNSITLAQMVNMTTASLIYRRTAGTGVPEVNSLVTLKSDLLLTGTNSGDQTITLTGDVTGSGTGSFATTIANAVVTLAKLANMATSSLFYRKTAGSGPPEVNSLATLKTDLNITDITGHANGDLPTTGGTLTGPLVLANSVSNYLALTKHDTNPRAAIFNGELLGDTDWFYFGGMPNGYKWTDVSNNVLATLDANGNYKLASAGQGFYIKEGTNATMGKATLVLGTVTVNTNKVTANSEIFISVRSLGTITTPVAVSETARVAGTSFTITSANLTDTSVISWIIFEPS